MKNAEIKIVIWVTLSEAQDQNIYVLGAMLKLILECCRNKRQLQTFFLQDIFVFVLTSPTPVSVNLYDKPPQGQYRHRRDTTDHTLRNPKRQSGRIGKLGENTIQDNTMQIR